MNPVAVEPYHRGIRRAREVYDTVVDRHDQPRPFYGAHDLRQGQESGRSSAPASITLASESAPCQYLA
jgi:hypothetical protein